MRVKTHPGEILGEGVHETARTERQQAGEEIGVPANRLSEIVRGRRGVTADTAIRLARRFGTTPDFWMNLQVSHDLSLAFQENDYSSVKSEAA